MAATGVGSLVTSEMMIDTKQIGRPEKFSGRDEDWNEFSFGFTNYLACLHPKLPEVMDKIAKMDTVYKLDDSLADSDRRTINMLYFILSQLCKGRSRRIIKKEDKTKNGLEAWRLLMSRYEPKDVEAGNRYTAMYMEILNPEFSLELTEIEDSILDWENLIDEYERETEDNVSDMTMKSVLTQNAPKEMQTHLSTNAASLTTYRDTRNAVVAFLRSKRIWAKRLEHKSNKEKPQEEQRRHGR